MKTLRPRVGLVWVELVGAGLCMGGALCGWSFVWAGPGVGGPGEMSQIHLQEDAGHKPSMSCDHSCLLVQAEG